MPTISADIFGEKEHPALVSIAAKSISPFDLSSDEWVKIDHGIRERAQFMAHVTNADFLQRVQDVTMRLASPLAGSDGKTVSNLDPKTAREVLREAMRLTGYEPDSATGGINPVEFTDTELDFKIRANRDIAWGFADYTHGTKDAEWMQQFPAWELVRIGERKIERDWFERWADAGGELYEGRMIARKDSEIWQALGDGEPNYRDGIGNPYPPFAWNSGMTVEEVERG